MSKADEIRRQAIVGLRKLGYEVDPYKKTVKGGPAKKAPAQPSKPLNPDDMRIELMKRGYHVERPFYTMRMPSWMHQDA